MAEAIAIPSPSAFLRTSPPPPTPLKADKFTQLQNARRPSPAQAKKKAPRKPSGLVNGVDGIVAKPKQSKSRNGCVTCKAKRLKCDEEKPKCQQCARRNVECGGYKKDFKWRPFEETNVKVNIERQKRGTSPKRISETSSKRTSPTPNNASDKTAKAAKSTHEPDESNESPENNAALPETELPERPKVLTRQDSASHTPVAELPQPNLSIIHDDMPPVSIAGFEPNLTDFHPGALSHLTPGLGLSPTLTESLWPFNTDDPMHQDFVNFELPEIYQSTVLDENEQMGDDDIDLLTRVDSDMEDMPMVSTAGLLTPTSSSTAGSPDDNPLGALGYIYPAPYFAEHSGEMLTLRFDRVTCGILSIMDGPNENPWRQLIWGLAQQSSALYHAVNAMAAFHSSTDIPRLRVTGHEHKAASIRFIQEGIRDNSFSLQTAIATALALGFAEAWDQHTNTGNTHIKGAQVLVKRALEAHKRNPCVGEELARLKFLCNAWVYMDVIARFTCFASEEADDTDFDNTYIFAGNPNDCPELVMGHNSPGFGIDFGMAVDTRLDPLMGCASTLFPLIGRAANVVRKVCRSQYSSVLNISLANDIKTALEAWDPPQDIEEPMDPTTSVEHTLQTAEAYRWATLLHLHQAVPELPSLTSTELAQRVLQYLATIPLTSRTVITHVFPLMIAGCEAKTEEDRQWIRDRWTIMNTRMRLGLLDKAHMVMEEVWRRRDTYEARPSTHRKLVATADIVRGPRRSRPFIRSQSGTMRLGNPGRTGMVYSYVETDDVRASGSEDDVDFKKRRARERRDGRDPRMDLLDPAYTVRGHLHWVGVMWDWGWEILLG